MEEIDRRRAVLEPLRAEKRKIRARLKVCWCGDCRDVVDGDLSALRAYKEEPAEGRVLEALREWWAQGCRDDIEAGCPCGKVAVLPGEDPLVMWCAAGHPTDGEGKIKIP
jgi:hypothetical protein